MENEADITPGISVAIQSLKCSRDDLTCEETRLDGQAYQSFHNIVRFLKSCVPLFQLFR